MTTFTMPGGTARGLLAGTAAAALAIAPVLSQAALAKSASTMQDLIGARAGQAEAEFGRRGWTWAAGAQATGEAVAFWWNAARKDCIRVTTRDGRYAAITDASAGDCNQKGSGTGTAVATAAAVGAVALTALLLSRKSKNRPRDEQGYDQGGYQPEWQQVEVTGVSSDSLRIFTQPSTGARVVRRVPEGTVLRNFGCEDYRGESWCEVATTDGRTEGWARDRYLRPTYGDGPGYSGGGNYSGGNYSGGNYSGGNWGDNGWGGSYRGVVEVYGLQSGTLKITDGPSKSARVIARVGAGTTLRSLGCQSVGGDNWCEVTSMNGRERGWARERYLRRQ